MPLLYEVTAWCGTRFWTAFVVSTSPLAAKATTTAPDGYEVESAEEVQLPPLHTVRNRVVTGTGRTVGEWWLSRPDSDLSEPLRAARNRERLEAAGQASLF
jgi:hypothetical protein